MAENGNTCVQTAKMVKEMQDLRGSDSEITVETSYVDKVEGQICQNQKEQMKQQPEVLINPNPNVFITPQTVVLFVQKSGNQNIDKPGMSENIKKNIAFKSFGSSLYY